MLTVIDTATRKAFVFASKIKGFICNQTGNVSGEMEALRTQLEENQYETLQKLSGLIQQVAHLKRELSVKEQEHLEYIRNNLGDLLQGLNLDKSILDEFIENPTPEKFEEIRKKYLER